MKIAIVHPSLATKGGAENVVMWLAGELARRGHDVSVVTLGFDKGLWPNFKSNFAIKELNIKNSKLGWVRAGFAFVTKYRKELQSFDVVNPHLVPSYIWVSLAEKFSAKFPEVVWYCEEPPRNLYAEVMEKDTVSKERMKKGSFLSRKLYGLVDKWAIKTIDVVLANSEFTAGWIKKIYKKEAKVCWPGVPIKNPASEKGLDRKGILTVGKLLPLKNIESVLEAVSVIIKNKLLKNLSGFKLKLVGEGPEKDKLKSLAKSKGIEGYVDFLGFVPDSKLPELYAQSRVVAATPLNEPFGLTIVEAMLNERPVVASNQGGPSEIVEDGVTGFLADPLNPQEVAEAIAELINNPELAKEMGEAGCKRAIKHFTLQKFVDRFEKALAEG